MAAIFNGAFCPSFNTSLKRLIRRLYLYATRKNLTAEAQKKQTTTSGERHNPNVEAARRRLELENSRKNLTLEGEK